MDLNLDLNLVQSQKILLTPKLKQALDILKVNSQELFEYIEEQFESNPVLESLDNEEYTEDNDYEHFSEISFSGDTSIFLIPDIVVKKIKDNYELIFNEDAIPLININQYYRKILSSDVNAEVKKFIQNQIDSAVWLIKCIEQRKNTIMKVADFIVKREYNFFEKGKGSFEQLTLSDAASELEIHESIIESTISGKFIQCKWGIFEMRCFFIQV